MNQDKIGKLIKKIRKDNNLTQADFAKELGVTYQAVSKWENGKNIPDISILKKISNKYNIDINDLLDGNSNIKKNNNMKFIILILILVAIIFCTSFYFYRSNSFEFKQVSSNCSVFTLNGSIAYNNKTSSIYISDIEYCGKKDDTIYKKISCVLYEKYNNTEKVISKSKTKNNIKLEEYFNDLKFNIDNYSSMCRKFSSSNLFIEVKAVNEDNKTIEYTIPIKLRDNCE